MKELTHTGCGGEVEILFVYKTERYESVEFKCIKCKKEFSYDTGGEY